MFCCLDFLPLPNSCSFSNFALEVWVGRSGLALVCLCPLSRIRSVTRSQDAGLGMLNAGPCWCVLIFSDQQWCVSFRCLWDRAVRVRWTQDSWRSLSLGRSTEDGALDGEWNTLCSTERSTEDGTLNRGLSTLPRKEHSTEGGVIFSRRIYWQRTYHLTQVGTVDAGLNAQKKMERSTQDSKLDGRRSALRRTRNAQCSSLYEGNECSTFFSFLCC